MIDFSLQHVISEVLFSTYFKTDIEIFVSKISFDNDSYISQNVGKIIHVEIEKAK